jgi:aminoglycoside phosphotransferase (APT) family kinase protein
MDLMDSLTADPFGRWFAGALDRPGIRVVSASRLTGGAIQQNWKLDTVDTHGEASWVLRTDAQAQVAVSGSRSGEYALLTAMAAAGVCVATPRALCETPEVIGRPFFITDFVPGLAAPHRLVRDDSLVPDRAALVFELGRNMARVHRVKPSFDELGFLEKPLAQPTRALIQLQRVHLDSAGIADPVLEWGLRWLELNAPADERTCLLHRDFRTGNYLVHDGRLSALLDWEFAGWGNPLEDLGWFTAKCWCFGRPSRAGGVGPLDAFLAGYREEGGDAPAPQDLHYWQMLAHARWAVIAYLQAQRHHGGHERSLELLLTGRIPSQLNLELLSAEARNS